MYYDDNIDRDIDRKEHVRSYLSFRTRRILAYCRKCGKPIYTVNRLTGEPYEYCYQCNTR